MYNEGISATGDLLDLAAEKGIVGKSGAWYDYDGAKIAQGREAAKQYLKDNPKAYEKILKEVLKANAESAE